MEKKAKQVTPKRFSKGEVRFTHDLYKAEVASMTKNVHYKKYEHKFEDVEHCHFYHSVNNRGKEQAHCSPIGGHTHEIETYIDEKGELQAKCGPPIKRVWKQGKGGTGKWVWEKIVFEDQWGEVVREDNHTHEMTYKGSEEVTLASNAAAGASAMASYAQASAMSRLEQSAAKGARLAVER